MTATTSPILDVFCILLAKFSWYVSPAVLFPQDWLQVGMGNMSFAYPAWDRDLDRWLRTNTASSEN